jgi:hypothetical protein
VRLNPMVMTASRGDARTRELRGRVDDPLGAQHHPAVAATNTSRISAARPGHPASSRSVQAAGLSEPPKAAAGALAVKATTNSSVPTSASAHSDRRKRTVVTMYSGPSGHAAPIRTPL